jgi:2-(1,2-epoxy-1,2-dihydrophenyl)acetyl-CoA isomerase
MNETVLYEAADGIATITLNRPERLNAMNATLLQGALEALEMAAADDDVRAVILTGAGRGFCAGGDLTSPDTLGTGPPQSRIRILRTYMRSSQLLREMPKVTIAAVNGPCAGAGMSWACAADLRYAAASARFVTAFLNAGLSGDFGGTWTLPRIVGRAKARELYFLSEAVSADEAERVGLVTRTLPDGELMPYVRGIARKLADSAPITLRYIKQNLNDADHMSFAQLLDAEAVRHVTSGTTEDQREAARAFIEKRQARLQGPLKHVSLSPPTGRGPGVRNAPNAPDLPSRR